MSNRDHKLSPATRFCFTVSLCSFCAVMLCMVGFSMLELDMTHARMSIVVCLACTALIAFIVGASLATEKKM
jgi:hypothetical protein